MEEWKSYKLSDVAFLSTGFPFDGHKYAKEGIRVVRGDNVTIGSLRWDSDKDKRWSEPFSRADEYTLQDGDIVIGMDGSRVGKNRAQVNATDLPLLLAQRVACIRHNEKSCQEFLFYQIFSERFVEYIKSVQTGTSIPHVSLKQIGDFPIQMPPIEEQVRIAKILRSLDNKIALNLRINHNLEEQAQVLYKSYFVDFEPFKDGKFVDSELGMIPEGWRVAELGTVTRQSSQKVKDRIDVKVLSPVTTGELVLSEEYFTKQVFSESISKYIVVKPLHFAYNPARVNIGSIGMNMFSFDGCVSPVYVVFECEKGYHHFFDYYRKTASFKDEVLNRAIGGVRQTLSYKDFALIKLVYPPYDIVEKFNCIYAGLLENKNSIKREISKLSELRDTLLPKLLSGELKINDLTC